MTREQLDAIRARYADEPLLGEMRTDRFGNLITVTSEHPVVTLLAEVERLRAELDTAGEVLAATSLKCDYAFARGVAAMREAASRECWTVSDELADIPDMETEQGTLQNVAYRIRALPDPEDK